MGALKKIQPVKLIVGFIFHDPSSFDKAKRALEKCFGPTDFHSPVMPFAHTTYYDKEFGTPLSRAFVSFRRLIDPQKLADIKRRTNSLEQKFSRAGRRTINIDPGYLDLAKLVLASTKDYRHRIAIGKGIYAEVTLYFKGSSFQGWEWTYPDYCTAEYREIFSIIRTLYAQKVTR